MTVRNKIYYPDGIYFITFTCAGWLPLFAITNGYQSAKSIFPLSGFMKNCLRENENAEKYALWEEKFVIK